MSGLRYQQMLVSPHVGGGAKLAFELHKHLVGTAGPVSRLLLPGGGEAERMAAGANYDFLRYRVDRLAGRNRGHSIAENLRLCTRMPRAPGVVHIHAPFVYGAARPLLSLSRMRSVLHIHLDFPVEQLRWALRKLPDLIVVCADFMRGAVEDAVALAGHERANVKVIRNAVDLQRFQPRDPLAAKSKLNLGPEPLLMVVANLAPHKGQHTALRAVAELKAMGRDVRLMLVGAERSDGKGYETQLRQLAAELSIDDRVDFAGFRDDIPELLAAADFVLLPSTSEGLPLTILEAQATGTIVLAAPTAGIPEVIADGRSGFLLGAEDPAGYARTIARLLSSPQEVQAIRRTAQDFVRQHHDMNTYCARIADEYDRLLAPAKTTLKRAATQ